MKKQSNKHQNHFPNPAARVCTLLADFMILLSLVVCGSGKKKKKQQQNLSLTERDCTAKTSVNTLLFCFSH